MCNTGLQKLTRVRFGGLVFSAPLCSSWVSAPLNITCLVACSKQDFRESIFFKELQREVLFATMLFRKRHLTVEGDTRHLFVQEGNLLAEPCPTFHALEIWVGWGLFV